MVDLEFIIENCGLVVNVVNGTVRAAGEELLCQEREVLSSEGVAVVQTHEENDASEVTNELVKESIQW